jgi:hypothetical protein
MQFDARVRRKADGANRNCRADIPTRAVARAVALQRAVALLCVARATSMSHVLHRDVVVLLGHPRHRGVFVMRMTAAETLRHRCGSRTLQRDREQQTDHGAGRRHAASVVPALTIFNTRWCGFVTRAARSAPSSNRDVC